MAEPESPAKAPIDPDRSAAASLFANRYGWWLGGIGVSLFGSAIFGFALSWAATGEGGSAAGLVNSVRLVPGLVLVLLGGAWADRHGPWWVMMLSDAAMAAAGGGAALAFHWLGTPVWLLVAVAVCIGTANSLYIPASAVVPRLLVGEDQLGRAMAARTVIGQAANLIAPPLGGFAVVAFGIATLSWANAVTYLIIWIVLLASRRQLTGQHTTQTKIAEESGHDTEASGTDSQPPGLLRQAWAGLVHCVREPALRTFIIAVGVVAAILLPLSSILIPLIARSHHWSAQAAGLIAGAQVVGGITVSLLVVWRGLWPRPGRAAAIGLTVAGAACIGLAQAPTVPLATAAGAGIGIGLGVVYLPRQPGRTAIDGKQPSRTRAIDPAPGPDGAGLADSQPDRQRVRSGGRNHRCHRMRTSHLGHSGWDLCHPRRQSAHYTPRGRLDA